MRGVPIIKPCPPCGKKLEVDMEKHVYSVTIGKTFWVAVCLKSHGGCDAQASGRTRVEAIKNWNREV